MAATDLLDNKLEEGDLVRVNLDGGSQVIGRIQKIESGGIVTGLKRGGAEVEPGRIIVAFIETALFDPRNGKVPSILKLYPNEDAHPELRPSKAGLIVRM